MKAKKTLIPLLFTSCMAWVVACEEKANNTLSDSSLTGLSEDYMYTLTIPEIMEVSITQVSDVSSGAQK